MRWRGRRRSECANDANDERQLGGEWLGAARRCSAHTLCTRRAHIARQLLGGVGQFAAGPCRLPERLER
eukprot:scaffold241994_cov26-Tisochrysis_lutea.AAC.2